MYTIEGRLKFITPFLYNRPSDSNIEKSDEGRTGGRKTKTEKIAEAYDKVHSNGHGLCIPAHMFLKSLAQGCDVANLKLGKRRFSPYVEAAVVPDDLLFHASKPDGIFEHWGRIPPVTGALVKIRRPMMKTGRHLDFTLHVADDAIPPTLLRAGVDAAGLYVSVGSWRRRFGKFQVVKWQVTK